LRNAPNALDRAFTIGRVLEHDAELATRALGLVLYREALDVALAREDACERLLDLRRRHDRNVVEGGVRVPNAREHVGDGIGHRHDRTSFTTTPWSCRGSPQHASSLGDRF